LTTFKSLDFVVNSARGKIFDTKSQDIVQECREIFSCLSAESTISGENYCQKISYATYLLSLMTQKNFLRYDIVAVQLS